MENLRESGDCSIELLSPHITSHRAPSLTHHLTSAQLELHLRNSAGSKFPVTAVDRDLDVLHCGEYGVQVEASHLEAKGQISPKYLYETK